MEMEKLKWLLARSGILLKLPTPFGRDRCIISSGPGIQRKNGSLLTFAKAEEYAIGDIVFCKVKGRYIDAHKVVKKDTNKGFLIANNHGFENGWTKIIYGKVIMAEYQGKIIYNVE